jgi:hypothetical protein
MGNVHARRHNHGGWVCLQDKPHQYASNSHFEIHYVKQRGKRYNFVCALGQGTDSRESDLVPSSRIRSWEPKGNLDRDRSGNLLERLLICVEGHRQEKVLL